MLPSQQQSPSFSSSPSQNSRISYSNLYKEHPSITKRKKDIKIFIEGGGMACFVLLILSMMALSYRSSYNSVLSEIERLKSNVKVTQGYGNVRNTNNEMSQMVQLERQYNQNRENAFNKQLEKMQQAIQRENLRTVLERFGEGPHHVTFTVKFHKPTIEIATFRVELAPFRYMPHTNYFFLEQVYHELWDNTWFYINGQHVLQAGPQDWDIENQGQAMKRFREARLDTMSFPEYSPSYPHTKWTLGFAGRPGGPDFYINKMDNTILHGPGQSHKKYQSDNKNIENLGNLEELADPCFAQVIDGKDVLQRIFNQDAHYPGSGEIPYLLKEPVEILTARIDEDITLNRVTIPSKEDTTKNIDDKNDHQHPYRTSVNQETMI